MAKNHGQTPLENLYFLDFFKSWLFLSKKHSFLSRVSKNDVSWLDMPKNRHWEKWPFSVKSLGLTRLENFEFLDFFKSWLFFSKKHSSLSRISRNDLSLLDLPKNRKWGKWSFLAKNHGLTLWKMFYVLDCFKSWLFCLKSILFYPEYQKKIFPDWICPKPRMRKMIIFGQNPWTNPFGKFWFFGVF